MHSVLAQPPAEAPLAAAEHPCATTPGVACTCTPSAPPPVTLVAHHPWPCPALVLQERQRAAVARGGGWAGRREGQQAWGLRRLEGRGARGGQAQDKQGLGGCAQLGWSAISTCWHYSFIIVFIFLAQGMPALRVTPLGSAVHPCQPCAPLLWVVQCTHTSPARHSSG